MRTNCTITTWLNRTGSDAYGQPVRTDQHIAPIAALLEAKIKRLVIAGREVVSSVRVHIAGNSPIAAGDQVKILGVDYQVLEQQFVPTPTGTLTHTTLLLG